MWHRASPHHAARALALVGVPAAALRGCVGNCAPTVGGRDRRSVLLLAGGSPRLDRGRVHDGRSPDVMAAPGQRGGDRTASPWPSAAAQRRRVPSVRSSAAGSGAADSPGRVSLDQIAPTLAPLLGLHRPHPEVRAGARDLGVVASGARTPLVVIVVGKASAHAGVRPRLPRPAARARTRPEETTGSLPLDPTRVAATIGTGGLPSQHGITGSLIRNENGDGRAGVGPGAPQPVIATLADDLDRRPAALADRARRPRSETPGWPAAAGTPGPIRDRTVSGGADPPRAVGGFPSRGWGRPTPDLLAVSLGGYAGADDSAIVVDPGRVFGAVPDATFVVTGTGQAAGATRIATVPTPDRHRHGGRRRRVPGSSDGRERHHATTSCGRWTR